MSQLTTICDDPTLWLVYFDIITPTASLISLLLMIPAICKYIKLNKIENKCIYRTCLIYFITIFLSIIVVMLVSIYTCRDSYTRFILRHIFRQLYPIQTLLLLCILFARMYVVFNGTLYALSTITIRFCSILYLMIIVIFIVTLIVHMVFETETELEVTMSGLQFLMIIILTIILISLFVYKMAQVYKSADKDNNNPRFIGVITKMSLLSIISMFSTLLNGMGAIIVQFNRSAHVVGVSMLLIIFDLTTNFWCIILSFGGYNNWYLKVCGYCDSKCKRCWYKIVQEESKESVEPNVVKVDAAK